ncbi:SCP2 domain-containing protein [Hydrogenophaga sp.]|uniref:ubiquinone biosynthesis accessory factor UbiJ n=1 Tax=Hydrogenophaga sp. TaxID=1904254 RepID=UPI003562FF20
MNNPSNDSTHAASAAPAGLLQSLLGAVRPPEWVVGELQNRLVLFLNHVLMQEPQAQDRLRRQKGKTMRVQWGEFYLVLAPTPAGLLEQADAGAKPELTLSLTQTSPFALVQRVLSGEKPAVDIQGDVQLAAEVAWLVDNVRWDVEEDLSRLVGDAMAHTLTRFAQAAAQALKGFARRVPPGFPPAGPGPVDPNATGTAAGSPNTSGSGR